MKTKKTFKQLLALLLLQMLGLFYLRVEAQTCFSQLEKFPKLVKHQNPTGESKITVMQLGSLNQRLFAGGYSKDPLSGYNDGTQAAFIGFIDNQNWKWRQSAFSFPSYSDPTVASIALRLDESKVAVLFQSLSMSNASDSFIFELDALTGLQTSATKLKLPLMTWTTPQGMVYLEDSPKTLMIAFASGNSSLSKNYIAAVNFAKQGAEQVKIFKLEEVDQLITHLALFATSQFYMASSLTYNYDGSTVSGIRLIRYSYDQASDTLSTVANTKALIYNNSFPFTFGNQSPKLTSFRIKKSKNEVCGSIKRFDSTSEDVWLFTYTVTTDVQNTLDFKTPGTMKTILDCNPYSSFITWFLVQEVTAGETKVRVMSLDQAEIIDITVYPVLSSRSDMTMTAATLMTGNTSYSYFAMLTKNIFATPSDFPYPTAAIYYSSRNFGSCISQESSSINQSYSAGGLELQKEDSLRYTPTLSAKRITESIVNSSFQSQQVSVRLTANEDLCLDDNKSYALSSTTFSKSITLSAIDFTQKTLSFGITPGITNLSCNDQSTYQRYYISAVDKALPGSLNIKFDHVNNSIIFQLQSDHISTESVTYTIKVGFGLPEQLYNDNIGTIQLTIANKCMATIQSSSQPTIPVYKVNIDGTKVYNFNAFSYAPSNSAGCNITYSLAITKADGSSVSFALNDSYTTFMLEQTPSLTFLQNNIYTTAGSYKLLLTGSLYGTTETTTVEISFNIALSCKGSPINWNGSSNVFTNISYSMWDPTSVTNWLWTDVNVDPSQITTQPPSGQTCGRVVLEIRNQDTTSLESSLFFYDQTNFAAGLSTFIGGATAGTYNLAVFFMYEDSLIDGPYYTNKKDFQVVVTDLCAQQTDSKVKVNAFVPVKYLLGHTKISIDVTDNGRVAFDPAYCPWMATVTTFHADGTSPVVISSGVFNIMGNQSVQNPSNVSIETFYASYAADQSLEGSFKVDVKYSLGYVFSTQTYLSSKSEQFALTISSCASQFQPPNGLTTVSYRQLDPKMFVDVSGTLLDSNCLYTLTMSTTVSSIIDLTGTSQVGVLVNSYDRTKLGSYTVSLTYIWNQSLNSQLVNFTVLITDNCSSEISVPANQSFSYQLMDAGQNFTLNPTISQAHCTFDFDYESGSDINLDKIFTFSSGTNLDKNSVVALTLSQSVYDSSPVGSYSVVFRFSWSNASSFTVTMTIEITDACKTDVNPIDPATITYQLMSTSQSISVLPTASLSYCNFSIKHTTGSVGSLLTWSDFQGTNSDPAQLSIFSGLYLKEFVGDTQLTLRYSWSKNETRDVIITVSVGDACILDLVPQTPIDFNYILMQAANQVSVKAMTSFDYCLVSITLQSAIKSGIDMKTATIWQWIDQTDISRAAAITFGASQSIYDPSFVGEYDLVFQFTWSRSQTQTVTSKVFITDDCLTAIQLPTIADKSYKAMDPALAFNLNPTASTSFSYCKYSIQAVIKQSGVVVNDPAFTFVAYNDRLITETAQLLTEVTSIPSSSYGLFDVEVNYAISNSGFDYQVSFKVEIFDPCLTAPVSSSLLVDQQYGINSSAVEYIYTAFVITPSQCVLNYAYTSSDDSKTDFFIIFDGSRRKFTFQSNGLDLSVYGATYTLTIKATNPANGQTTVGTFAFKITDPCETALIQFQQSVFVDKTYNFPLDSVVYSWVDPFTTSNYSEAQCGALLFEFYENNLAIDSSTLFFVDRVQKTFTVHSDNDRTQTGLHTIVLKSWHANFINSLTEFSFNVNVDSSKCDTTALTTSGILYNGVNVGNTMTYFIGQEQQLYEVEFITGIKGCPLTSLKVISDQDVSDVVSIESKNRRRLLQFANAPSKEIRVRMGGSKAKEGVYSFKIQAVAGLTLILEFILVVQLPCRVTQLTVPANPPDLVYIGETANVVNWQSFKHNGVTAFCNLEFTYALRTQRLNDSPRFPSELVNFYPEQKQLIISGYVARNGTYNVYIDALLNDIGKQKASISFQLKFIAGKNDKPYYINTGQELTPLPNKAQLDLQTNLTSYNITKTGATVLLPSNAPLGKKERTQQQQPSGSSPFLAIKSIDRWSVVTLTCSKNMQKRSNWNITDFQSALNVTIKPAYDQAIENLEFTWKFKDMRQNVVRLQLNFSSPLLVSAASTYDRLQVQTNLTQLNYLFYIESAPFTEKQLLDHYIPYQLDEGTLSEAIKTAGDTIRSATGGIAIGSLASNFFLSGTVAFLWGMINALQIIVHLPMINVRFPANVSMFFSNLLSIANFKVINMENFIDQLNNHFGIKPEFTNENFAENGFGSASITRSLGVVSIVALVLGAVSMLMLIIHKFLEKCKCGHFILRMFWERLFWKVPIRFALESYLGFCIATLISYQVQQWGQWKDTFGSMCNVTILAALCFLPVYILWFLQLNLNNVDKLDFQKKFHSFYLNISSYDERNLIFNSLFCARRMLFAMSITFLRSWPAIQIMVLVHSTTVTMCFNAFFQPFVNKVLNYLEVMNEVSILIIIYHMIVFTDFVDSRSTQYVVGYSVCIFTGLNICINVIFLFSNLATTYYMRFKKSIHVCLKARKIKQIQLRKKAKSQLMIELKEVQKLKKEEHEAEEIYQEHKRTACKIMNQSGAKGEKDQDCQLEPYDDYNSSAPKLLNNTFNSEYENDTIQSKETPRRSSQESLMLCSPVQEFKPSSFNPKKKEAIKDFETTTIAQINVRMAASVFEKSLQ